ncbi:hypothetical protein C8R44DRAFT_887977 [Mycena epipterygia]|nr:hypothetical protein C8R44DRAFT_887977 [Mycena epipterygia]
MSRFRAPDRANSTALQAIEEANTKRRHAAFSSLPRTEISQVHGLETPKHRSPSRSERAQGCGDVQRTALNNADWTLGTALGLMSYWISLFQEDNPRRARWFFNDDLRSFLGTGIMGFCGIPWVLVCVVASLDGGLRLADLLVETDPGGFVWTDAGRRTQRIAQHAGYRHRRRLSLLVRTRRSTPSTNASGQGGHVHGERTRIPIPISVHGDGGARSHPPACAVRSSSSPAIPSNSPMSIPTSRTSSSIPMLALCFHLPADVIDNLNFTLK